MFSLFSVVWILRGRKRILLRPEISVKSVYVHIQFAKCIISCRKGPARQHVFCKDWINMEYFTCNTHITNHTWWTHHHALWWHGILTHFICLTLEQECQRLMPFYLMEGNEGAMYIHHSSDRCLQRHSLCMQSLYLLHNRVVKSVLSNLPAIN